VWWWWCRCCCPSRKRGDIPPLPLLPHEERDRTAAGVGCAGPVTATAEPQQNRNRRQRAHVCGACGVRGSSEAAQHVWWGAGQRGSWWGACVYLVGVGSLPTALSLQGVAASFVSVSASPCMSPSKQQRCSSLSWPEQRAMPAS
jgi:hypothetical protein